MVRWSGCGARLPTLNAYLSREFTHNQTIKAASAGTPESAAAAVSDSLST